MPPDSETRDDGRSVETSTENNSTNSVQSSQFRVADFFRYLRNGESNIVNALIVAAGAIAWLVTFQIYLMDHS